MTTATQSRLHLSLPSLKYPLYWELEVSNHSVWIKLMRRPFGLWRNGITSKAMALVSHHGELTQEVLDEISRHAYDMVAGTTEADRVFAALAPLVGDEVKVVLDR